MTLQLTHHSGFHHISLLVVTMAMSVHEFGGRSFCICLGVQFKCQQSFSRITDSTFKCVDHRCSLKDKASDVLDFCYCRNMKDQNQRCVSLSQYFPTFPTCLWSSASSPFVPTDLQKVLANTHFFDQRYS